MSRELSELRIALSLVTIVMDEASSCRLSCVRYTYLCAGADLRRDGSVTRSTRYTVLYCTMNFDSTLIRCIYLVGQ